MIQVGTSLKVIDNSGAREVACIGVLSGYRQHFAYIGDIVTISVKKLRTRRRSFSKVKKGEVLKGLLLRMKTPLLTKHGNVSFFENSVILINQQGKLIGTRIFGALPKYLRSTKHMRLISLAAGLIF